MRVGILGGTFDPVHNGHLLIALEAAKRFGLDRVMLLPAGDPPHKTHPVSKEDRLEMTRRAAAAHSDAGFFACGIEIDRAGTTYTVDTLNWLRANNPETDWFYLIGADTLSVLDSWRRFDEVAKLCTFIASGRADDPADEAKIRQLETDYGARVLVSRYSGPDLSSTDIRRRVNAGQDITGSVPDAVRDYIIERGLYLADMGEEEIRETLRGMLRPSRYEHTMGVVKAAESLAESYGVPRAKARLTALLHDCAKYVPLEDMQRIVRENFADADEAELASPAVLHAPCGAYVARTRFGVNDPEILQAIRRHTLGDAGMSALDALIYVSDFIEEGRPAFRGIEECRAAAQRDIFEAARLCAFYTADYLKRKGLSNHPKSIRMMNDLHEKES